MRLLTLLFLISFNLYSFSQWNYGNISLAQVRSDIEFIDSNHLLVAGGQVWFSASNNSITSLAHLYDITTKQSTIAQLQSLYVTAKTRVTTYEYHNFKDMSAECLAVKLKQAEAHIKYLESRASRAA